MLPEGADVSLEAGSGWTALCEAAFEGHAEVAGLLIHSGADVSQQGADWYTGLLRTVERSHTATAELLLDYGADPSLETDFGCTVMSMDWIGYENRFKSNPNIELSLLTGYLNRINQINQNPNRFYIFRLLS